ncbi:MAG: hypothetical protein AAFY75_06010, partial [Pseudomonadota bacterium]
MTRIERLCSYLIASVYGGGQKRLCFVGTKLLLCALARQQGFRESPRFFSAMQHMLIFSSFNGREIVGFAVKESIRPENHLPFCGRNCRGMRQCAFNFGRRTGHIDAQRPQMHPVRIGAHRVLGDRDGVRWIDARKVADLLAHPRRLTAP